MKHIAIKTAAFSLAATLLLAGCGGINKSATLVNIDKGKDSISLGYGNFVARYTQSTYDSMYRGYFGDSFWSQDMYGDGKTMEQTVKKEVMNSMEENYLAKKHASEYDVEISKDEQKKIDKAAKEFMKDNEEDAIQQMGATEEYASEMMEYQTYGTLVKNKIREETKVKVAKKDYEESTISYAKFSMTKEEDSSDSSDASAESDDDVKKAAEASAKAVAEAKAKKFDDTVTAQGGTVETASYVIAGKSSDEDLDEKVIDAAKKLDEGEISDVIEVEDDAYYVIRKDKQKDKDASSSKKSELEEKQKDDHYDKILKGWKKETDWDVDKKQWKKVKFDSLFEAPKQEENEENTEETTEESTDAAEKSAE